MSFQHGYKFPSSEEFFGPDMDRRGPDMDRQSVRSRSRGEVSHRREIPHDQRSASVKVDMADDVHSDVSAALRRSGERPSSERREPNEHRREPSEHRREPSEHRREPSEHRREPSAVSVHSAAQPAPYPRGYSRSIHGHGESRVSRRDDCPAPPVTSTTQVGRRSSGLAPARPPPFWSHWNQIDHLLYQIPSDDLVSSKYSILFVGTDWELVPQNMAPHTCNLATYLALKNKHDARMFAPSKMRMTIRHHSTDGSHTDQEVHGNVVRLQYTTPSGSSLSIVAE